MRAQVPSESARADGVPADGVPADGEPADGEPASGRALGVPGLHLCIAINALFEFLLGLANRPGQLRQLGAAEQQEGDDKNDEEFRAAECDSRGHGKQCSGAGGFCTWRRRQVIECVVNVSEGRDHDVLAKLADACGTALLDIHTDSDHNRSVFTLVGTDAPRRLAQAAVESIDLTAHEGVHPRLGAVDVVPFVAIDEPRSGARAARDDFARWAGDELALPCFTSDEQRPLPEVRRRAFVDLMPDHGPELPHPTAGACAVGVRDLLVAYNVWLPGDQIEVARRIARSMRSEHVRALGLTVGDRVQVSMNLIAPDVVGPAAAFDKVSAMAAQAGATTDGAELVGLLPASVLDRIDPHRWAELGLGADKTIEFRINQAARG